jgi:hypothetical protein
MWNTMFLAWKMRNPISSSRSTHSDLKWRVSWEIPNSLHEHPLIPRNIRFSDWKFSFWTKYQVYFAWKPSFPCGNYFILHFNDYSIPQVLYFVPKLQFPIGKLRYNVYHLMNCTFVYIVRKTHITIISDTFYDIEKYFSRTSGLSLNHVQEIILYMHIPRLTGRCGLDRMVVVFTTTYRVCNQCTSPLKLWVRTPFIARSARYNTMW